MKPVGNKVNQFIGVQITGTSGMSKRRALCTGWVARRVYSA